MTAPSPPPPPPVRTTAAPLPAGDDTLHPPHRNGVWLRTQSRPGTPPSGGGISRLDATRATDGASGEVLDELFQANSIKERYQMIFQQMSDGFTLFECICDARGDIEDFRLIDINPAAERILAMKAAVCIGTNLHSFLPDLDPELRQAFIQVATTGSERRLTTHFASREKHFSLLAFRPRPGQFACIFQDITERRQLEAQFFHAQKMEVVGQLASGVAHDYNNILTSTLLLLGMLLGDSSQPRHMVDALKELEGETKRAARLTRQLLAFSRKHPAQIKPVNLHELLSHLFTMLNRLLGEHIQVEILGNETPLWIEADAGMIEQVVINLCINARDAMMPAGGRLTLQTALVPVDAALRRNHPEATRPSYARLSVTDTGCGMDDVTLRRIFEPFFTTKGRQHGTGLGLVTVQNITRQHHGWLDVHTRIGSGSTFDVYLPVLVPSSPSATASVSSRHASDGDSLHGTETILLVEDEASVRQTAAASLRAYGYEVIEANDATTALRCWRQTQHRIDLLLTDMVMPCGVSGMELALQLSREQPTLKIIVSSGYNAPPQAAPGTPSMNDCYLPKPYDTRTLLATIRQHLDQT
ncbi:hybrid sensor histidine kinase/response regulator [Geminisphaera colitermitum]|uniref:hybrid sensor histidine kinase/response regulator n=1 Tax=Geminisphaera colitermitum TaxID=1148786 RepID=UPI001E2C181B|nr:PAS domain-containing sensor histidine kinase [Geminisphaera colitermitum]